MHCWQTFIKTNWVALVSGKKIWINVRDCDHPRFSPLFKANTGWPTGQNCDFTASYKDGSRVHIQCFGAEGGVIRLRIHRDQFDPDQGPLNLLLHGLFETPAGPMIALAALVGGGLRVGKIL